MCNIIIICVNKFSLDRIPSPESDQVFRSGTPVPSCSFSIDGLHFTSNQCFGFYFGGLEILENSPRNFFSFFSSPPFSFSPFPLFFFLFLGPAVALFFLSLPFPSQQPSSSPFLGPPAFPGPLQRVAPRPANLGRPPVFGPPPRSTRPSSSFLTTPPPEPPPLSSPVTGRAAARAPACHAAPVS